MTSGVLLFCRKRKDLHVLLVFNGNSWSIPKGGIENRESRRRTAIRELEEETSIKAPARLDEIGYVDREPHERLYCFVGYSSGKPKPADDAEIADFYPINQAMKMIAKYQLPLLEILYGLEQTMRYNNAPLR